MLSFVPLKEIRRIREISDPVLFCKAFADVIRINTLYMITKAGSGHIGTSFSSTDIITWLWTQEMISPNEKDEDPSDVYFSSKGHDVPALYALLIAIEKIDFEKIHMLRRLGGLPGHPDIANTPEYLVTNTGSLGMGISKARGMAEARRLDQRRGRLYVLTGDGELQEGQIWESLQPAANRKFSEITVIVDHNKIQSDAYVRDVSDLGDVEKKFRAFDWEVLRVDGHDFGQLQKAFARAKITKDRPQVIIADTKKGKGVSFMEEMDADGFYKFHAGAPKQEQYEKALQELTSRLNALLQKTGQEPLSLETVEIPEKGDARNPIRLTNSYGEELVSIGRENKNIVVLDADLIKSCGLVAFREAFPERFIECGIAEQDMVSLAGGLALEGKLPILHSLACFLTPRPNEQIYNNTTEETKIIYVGTQAGLLPAGPGHSHQSVRDVALMGSIPGITIIQPGDEKEMRSALRWAVEKNPKSTYLRVESEKVELPYAFPDGYVLEKGKGVIVRDGNDSVIISYGMVMLSEAVKAARILEEKNISLRVVNLPWLNVVDREWLKEIIGTIPLLVTLDNHYRMFGQGMYLADFVARHISKPPRIISLGIEEVPACGGSQEVLEHHNLDAKSIAGRIAKELKNLD
ncbi:MAG: transketolase [Candidatus Niyogibacteria bacterium]|nr:transketolase [Candidatus Niyogibacteria bacterium]